MTELEQVVVLKRILILLLVAYGVGGGLLICVAVAARDAWKRWRRMRDLLHRYVLTMDDPQYGVVFYRVLDMQRPAGNQIVRSGCGTYGEAVAALTEVHGGHRS